MLYFPNFHKKIESHKTKFDLRPNNGLHVSIPFPVNEKVDEELLGGVGATVQRQEFVLVFKFISQINFFRINHFAALLEGFLVLAEEFAGVRFVLHVSVVDEAVGGEGPTLRRVGHFFIEDFELVLGLVELFAVLVFDGQQGMFFVDLDGEIIPNVLSLNILM